MSQLFITNDKIIVGGKNKLYSVDMDRNTALVYDDDESAENQITTCLNDGRSKEKCQNYYKVLLQLSDTDLMICGTSGFNPKCDVRSTDKLDFASRAHIRSGNGICPADPSKSTSYLGLKGNEAIGFAGSCIDSCTDNAIFRLNLQPGSFSISSRTFISLDMLDDPAFVYSFEEGDYVYFVFRETAVEVNTERVYSRIARICKNDVGSSSALFNGYFNSFFKARFYCTSDQAGQSPFDHDEVGGAVYIDKTLYAAFSGPKNLHTGSILCSFTIADISAVFDGPYIAYDRDARKWAEVKNDGSSCIKKRESWSAVNRFLMKKSIHDSKPLYSTETDERIVAIAAVKKDVSDTTVIMVYAGSDQGKVHRVAHVQNSTNQIYTSSSTVGLGPVISIRAGDGKVYALGDTWLTSLPIQQQCDAQDCSSCISSHFPFCGWCYDTDVGRWSCSEQKECKLANFVQPTDSCEPLPTFSRAPENITLKEGETASFFCTSHDPFKKVFWTKEGGPLPRKAGLYSKDSMYIPAVDIADAGFYECSQNNTSGVVSKRAYLSVQVPARFAEHGQPTNVTVTNDHDVILTCRVVGMPQPEVSWVREGGYSILPEGSTQQVNGDLKIIRVQEQDEGMYRCEIRTKDGVVDISGPAYVNVLDTKDYQPEPNGAYTSTPISITVLAIAIVIAAVVCFVIGLTVRMIYRRRKHKRDYIDNNSHGAYSQCGALTHDPDGYLYPDLGRNWSTTWHSFHQQTLSPNMGRAPMFVQLDDEAPPAYSPGGHSPTLPPVPHSWYSSPIQQGSHNSNSTERTDVRSGDYATITTLPLNIGHNASPMMPPSVPTTLPPQHLPPRPNYSHTLNVQSML